MHTDAILGLVETNVSDISLLETNKFLSGLINNNIPVLNFTKSQESFINCVNYWSQILGKLVYRLNDFTDRKLIIENLCDKHGIDAGLSHVETFTQFIIDLGGTISNNLYDIPSTIFNHNLGSISDSQLPIFIATLGFIEYYYQKISGIIVKYLKANNKYSNIHYEEHELLDVKHYTDLFSLLVKYSDNEVKRALHLGSSNAITLFNDYYNGCYKLYCEQ